MNIKAAEGHIWVWSEKGELAAVDIEPRPAGEPAWLGDIQFNQYAPKAWAEAGYIEQKKRE